MERQLDHSDVSRSGNRYPLSLVCPGWHDPRNVGSAFRLADAAGIAGLVLGGTTPVPPNTRINKTARSTVRSVPWRQVADTAAYVRERRHAGDLVIGLEITSGSEDLLTADLTGWADRPTLLLAGAEDRGLPPELIALCDRTVHLPMHGQNTSMNVAVALGAAVYLLLAKAPMSK